MAHISVAHISMAIYQWPIYQWPYISGHISVASRIIGFSHECACGPLTSLSAPFSFFLVVNSWNSSFTCLIWNKPIYIYSIECFTITLTLKLRLCACDAALPTKYHFLHKIKQTIDHSTHHHMSLTRVNPLLP